MTKSASNGGCTKTRTMKKLVMQMLAGALLGVFAIGTVLANPNRSEGFKAQQQNAGDSVVINFGKGGKMVVYLKSKEDWDAADEIDFNKLMKEMKVYVDSAKQTEDGKVQVSNEWGDFSIYAEKEEKNFSESIDLQIDFEDGFHVRMKDSEQKEYKARKHSSYTDFYIGLNNFTGENGIPDGTPYDLRTGGSRYFELAFRRQARIGGEKTRLFFNYAVSFSWYNLMFEGNQKIVNQPDGMVGFETHAGEQLKKSKLTVSYINIPLMLKYKHKKFSLAAGGYVGYRIGSHSKIKYLDDRGDWEKDKEHSRFGLENVRYGLRAEINWIGPTFFATYDMNELFSPNSGAPQLNTFSFGIKL